jgi:glycosyltransferase involved in cell wall biosynthesis
VAPLSCAARLERLVWAIDQLAVVHRGVEHVLVGQGPLAARVQRRARVQQLAERLRVVPFCDVLPDLVRASQLVWQSGDVAYGGAILDAMACSVPVVAVASDAARQLIVDQVTGRIVPADPESEFPRRAFNVLEDAGLAARYGDAARQRAAEQFAVGPALERHVQAVERLVS